MSKWIFFLGGLVSGIIISIFALEIIGGVVSNNESQGLDGATFFEQPSQEISASSFKVFQVLRDNAALVHSNGKWNFYDGPVFLLMNNSGVYYYDEQVLDVPADCKVLQVGLYKYESKGGLVKTVPIIGIVKN